MKLLLDQNISPRLVYLLSDLYPDSLHVVNVGLDRALVPLLLVRLYQTRSLVR